MKRNEDASLMKERERENESGANIREAQQNAGFSLHRHPRHADRIRQNGQEKNNRRIKPSSARRTEEGSFFRGG